MTERRSRRFLLNVMGAVGSPIDVMIALLSAHAAWYSARKARNETDGSTSIERAPRDCLPPAATSSNHLDSTNVRCCTSPATFVPEGTVLRRASSPLNPASFLSTPPRRL